MQNFIAIVLLAALAFPLNAQEEEKGGEFSIDMNLRSRYKPSPGNNGSANCGRIS